MRNVRILRFITRRRLKWVAVIAAGLVAVLFVSTLWISPGFLTLKRDHSLWIMADRGRVHAGINSSELFLPRVWDTTTSIEESSPIGFDSSFVIEREAYRIAHTVYTRNRLVVPLWFPFMVCAALAVYLWRTDRAEPWQCAACRYDLRGIETDLCPECGKQSERAS